MSKDQRTDGFLHQWGPQAWIDMVMSKRMLMAQAGPIITYTFLPILRMSGDAELVDKGWEEIKSRREIIRLLDSPRERWRKRYGNFVRECEWALLELRTHFTREQYEEIVVGTAAALGRENSTSFLDMMNGLADRKPTRKELEADGPVEQSRWQSVVFEMFNPAHWLTGPAEITEFDPVRGRAVMEIPDCAWHTCGPRDRLPNPDKLPEEGCLLICKGAFEELFNGTDSPLKFEFDPHLPDTSCTATMSWKPVTIT